MNEHRRLYPGEAIADIPDRPVWFKVTGMLLQNWCVCVELSDSSAQAVFLDDLSRIFDRLGFASLAECERELRHNGFKPLGEDPEFGAFTDAPTFPLIEAPLRLRPIYSSGEYWLPIADRA